MRFDLSKPKRSGEFALVNCIYDGVSCLSSCDSIRSIGMIDLRPFLNIKIFVNGCLKEWIDVIGLEVCFINGHTIYSATSKFNNMVSGHIWIRTRY